MTHPSSENSSDTARLLVVCVVFNPGDELRDFGRSLASATTRDIDLVIVNNAAPSAIAQEVADAFGGTVLDGGGNVGYGTASNAGARSRPSEWIVIANPDLVWEPGSLDLLLTAAESHPEAGSLGPQLLNSDGTIYASARSIPSLRQGAGHALLGRVWPSNPWSRAYRREHEHAGTQERPVGWLSGACLLLRREAFEQIGGFDESYFMFFEDLDLGERLRDAGWINLYVPSARVTHIQGVSWKAKPEPMIRAHHDSARRYLHNRYSGPARAPLRLVISAALTAREQLEVRRSRQEH